jgi:hypothetical protein
MDLITAIIVLLVIVVIWLFVKGDKKEVPVITSTELKPGDVVINETDIPAGTSINNVDAVIKEPVAAPCVETTVEATPPRTRQLMPGDHVIGKFTVTGKDAGVVCSTGELGKDTMLEAFGVVRNSNDDYAGIQWYMIMARDNLRADLVKEVHCVWMRPTLDDTTHLALMGTPDKNPELFTGLKSIFPAVEWDQLQVMAPMHIGSIVATFAQWQSSGNELDSRIDPAYGKMLIMAYGIVCSRSKTETNVTWLKINLMGPINPLVKSDSHFKPYFSITDALDAPGGPRGIEQIFGGYKQNPSVNFGIKATYTAEEEGLLVPMT